MLVQGGLQPSIYSQIHKCLKLIREGGQHFSNKSEIQKSLKYPIGGKPIGDILPNFPVFKL